MPDFILSHIVDKLKFEPTHILSKVLVQRLIYEVLPEKIKERYCIDDIQIEVFFNDTSGYSINILPHLKNIFDEIKDEYPELWI